MSFKDYINKNILNEKEDSLIDKLESFIDSKGLSGVIEMLSQICSFKASHVEENWQDKGLSKEWEKASEIIDSIVPKLERLKI
jgi:hypothetical protein